MAGRPKGEVSDTARAEQLLREQLAHGPAMAAGIIETCKAMGIERGPLSDARKNLNVHAVKVGKGWEWSLPGGEAQPQYTMVDGLPVAVEHTLPAGELRDDTVYNLTGAIGIIGDVHAPFHHVKVDNGVLSGAYVEALGGLRDAGITTLLINGDFIDFYALSFHERDRSKRNLVWEIECARQMLAHLRAFFGPDVRIIYREGNHEERWWRYIQAKADEFKDVDDFQLASVLRLKNHNIEWIDGRCKVKAGELWLEHGHEFFGSGGVVPARNYLLKAMDNVLVNHVHRASEFYFRKPHGGVIAGFSVGCLCDVNPWWFARNNWTHGYAVVRVSDDGTFTVDNRIIL